MKTTTSTATSTVVIKPGMEKQVKELRAKRSELFAAIEEWEHGQVVIGDKYGWDDPRIDEYQGKIDACYEKIEALRADIGACLTVLPQVA